MYFKILKKDLKRKKTMNLILLIFIILAGTFISSSVNNLITISSALDGFMEKAGVADYIIMNKNIEETNVQTDDFIQNNPLVKAYSTDDILMMSDQNIKLASGKEFELSSAMFLCSVQLNQLKFFDQNDKELMVQDGEIYISALDMETNKLKEGEKLTICEGDFQKEFVIKGTFKDAFMGSSMMGAKRMLVSEHDYIEMSENTEMAGISCWSVNTKAGSLKQFVKEYNSQGISAIIACDQSLIKTTYIMDMLIAGILIVVSACLILISMVILRFTIVFTLQEEFREIGIMKAIGLQNCGIRRLYIIKYLAISCVGATIGFFLGIPFGEMFLKQISKNIVMSSNGTSMIINVICSLGIVLIVILFSYSCTRKVNKFSAIDAIRNGSNGERFKRKGFFKLSRAGKMPTVLYMAVNDIVSGWKRFSVLFITFTIGMILVIVPVNTINTLSDDSLVQVFGISKADVYMVNEEETIKFVVNGNKDYIENYIGQMEDHLKENDVDASLCAEIMFDFKISFEDNSAMSTGMQGIEIDCGKYKYLKGSAPKYENEVALTQKTADVIDTRIGDLVKIQTGEEEKEYLVTAMYQSMTNMGEGIRFSEKADLDYTRIQGVFALQAKLSDDLNKTEKKAQIEKIATLYPQFKQYTGGEYMSYFMGDITGQIEGVKQLILLVVIGINILVAVLMVKTFITKEKGEIGMLKSIGFTDTSLISWQTIRIGIIMLASALFGAVISGPISQVSSGQVFAFMGASQIEFVIKPFEVYLIYPLIVFVLTTFASAVTALTIKKISPQETNNIE